MSTRDISEHIEELYNFDVSFTLISNIIDKIKIIPIAKEWKNRPLNSVYSIVFLDTIHYKVTSDGKVVNKVAYIILGVGLD